MQGVHSWRQTKAFFSFRSARLRQWSQENFLLHNAHRQFNKPFWLVDHCKTCIININYRSNTAQCDENQWRSCQYRLLMRGRIKMGVKITFCQQKKANFCWCWLKKWLREDGEWGDLVWTLWNWLSERFLRPSSLDVRRWFCFGGARNISVA